MLCLEGLECPLPLTVVFKHQDKGSDVVNAMRKDTFSKNCFGKLI